MNENQKEKLEVLKGNEQQKKQFDLLLRAIDKALVDNFATYGKLVQADVSKFIYLNAIKDGKTDAGIRELVVILEQIMKEAGKDMEKSFKEQAEKMAKELCK